MNTEEYLEGKRKAEIAYYHIIQTGLIPDFNNGRSESDRNIRWGLDNGVFTPEDLDIAKGTYEERERFFRADIDRTK